MQFWDSNPKRGILETGMKWDALEEEPCSVARTIGVIGDRWNIQTATVSTALLSGLGLLFAWLYARGKTPHDWVRDTALEQPALTRGVM